MQLLARAAIAHSVPSQRLWPLAVPQALSAADGMATLTPLQQRV